MTEVVLVVAAHPDDEILGAGATLAKHVDAGDAVHAVVVSEGATARYHEGMTDDLQAAARASAARIGFTSLTFLGLADQRMDVAPLIEVTQSIEAIVHAYKPRTIYSHSPVDVNADHGVVARATWTAARPYAAPFVDKLLAFETPSSTEWAWPLEGNGFMPQMFVDVTATLDRKIEAMQCYQSELRPYPHPRSVRALRERAAFWGSKAGCLSAEPFVVLRIKA